jgi:predicted transcriptional regulator
VKSSWRKKVVETVVKKATKNVDLVKYRVAIHAGVLSRSIKKVCAVGYVSTMYANKKRKKGLTLSKGEKNRKEKEERERKGGWVRKIGRPFHSF